MTWQYYTMTISVPTEDGQWRFEPTKAAIMDTDHKRWMKDRDGAVEVIVGDGERRQVLLGNIVEMAPLEF